MRHKFRKFDKGLWVTPAEDELPDGSLRRGRGAAAIKTGSVKSRLGMSQLHNLNAHSITYFNDKWHCGASTSFYRETTAKKAGLSGDRLNFTAMPPIADVEDYLFVTGGDTLFKCDSSGNVTNWGIEAPNTAALTAVKQAASSKTIDNMERTADAGYIHCDARWKNASNYDDTTNEWGTGLGDDREENSTRTKEGTHCLKLRAAPGYNSCIYSYWDHKGAELDLTELTGGVTSLDTDFIVFWIRMNRADLWDYFQLDFSCGRTDFKNVVYSKRFVPDSDADVSGVATSSGDLTEYTTPESERNWMSYITQGRLSKISSDPGSIAARIKKLEQRETSEKFSALAITEQSDIWQEVKIAKNVFDRRGSDDTKGWANVRAIRLSAYSSTAAGTKTTVFFDDVHLDGGVGMQGTYQYAVTYYNSATGHRSNAGDDIVTVEDVRKEGVVLNNIPTSTDSQVTHREIWRTLGGGTLFWLCDRIADNVTITYTDEVADPDQDYDQDATVLSATELPMDNDPPYSTFTDCAYHLGAAFWIDDHDGRKGNVYYSPTGRTEAMKGYIRVTNDDDPLQKLFKWNDALYTIAESGIFRIDGSYPYVARRVYGCPGTNAPHTLAVSSYGVLYEGDQGVRLFNGMTSKLVAHSAIGSIFRGETAEQLTTFTGVVGTAGKEEYFISDGSQTIALNLQDGTWRDMGVGFNALHYAKDAEKLAGTYSSKVCEFEKEGVYTDNSTAISFSFQPKTLLLDEDKEQLITHLHVDANPASQTLAVYVVLDGSAVSLGNITDATRTKNTFAVGRYAQRATVRITGTLTARVEVFGCELDVKDHLEGGR